MDSSSGWWIQGNFPQHTTVNCVVGQCKAIPRDSSMTYYGINATGYHSISMEFVITPDEVEGSDYCEVLYSVNSVDFIALKNYSSALNGVTLWENVSMPNDANDQNNISIRFETVGFGVNGEDLCYIDEVYVYGILITPPPTPNPSMHPTTSFPNKTTNV